MLNDDTTVILEDVNNWKKLGQVKLKMLGQVELDIVYEDGKENIII